tara:strand:- start:480 stop:737 length:258 start_codon:yes stop_codon:yes gene_type:complete
MNQEENKRLNKLIQNHSSEWQSDNFEDWKTTEIMYCKIGWCIDAIDGSEELDEHKNILLSIQQFIEDLQKLEQEADVKVTDKDIN